jgi:hypothetical protein
MSIFSGISVILTSNRSWTLFNTSESSADETKVIAKDRHLIPEPSDHSKRPFAPENFCCRVLVEHLFDGFLHGPGQLTVLQKTI